MKKIVAGLSLLIASLSVQAVETAVGLSLSTFGPGAEITFGINEHISVRGHFSQYSIDLNDYVTDLDAIQDKNALATGEFELGAIGILFDYHPFGGKMRISTGLLQNNNELKTGAVVTNEPIGSTGEVYNGALSLNVDMGGTVPYFGIGFGSAASEGFPLGFGFDIGVVPMNVDVQYTLADSTQGISNLAIQQEVNEISKDTDDFKLFPFVNFMASYRF